MPKPDALTVNSLLKKISQFTVQKNLEKDPNPCKRRDLREILSSINKLLQAKSIKSIPQNGTAATISDEVIFQIDQNLTSILHSTQSAINNHLFFNLLNSLSDIYYLLMAIVKIKFTAKIDYK